MFTLSGATKRFCFSIKINCHTHAYTDQSQKLFKWNKHFLHQILQNLTKIFLYKQNVGEYNPELT